MKLNTCDGLVYLVVPQNAEHYIENSVTNYAYLTSFVPQPVRMLQLSAEKAVAPKLQPARSSRYPKRIFQRPFRFRFF